LPAYISAIAFELPDRVVDNAALKAENPGWDMARIEAKTGIKSRHIAEEDECASDLAFRAAYKLICGTGIDPSSIDVLLFCTQSPDYVLPASACLIQHRLGLPNTCAALDFNQGCSGYVYGLFLARSLICSGQARRVLLLTGDTYSRYIHRGDRSVRVLFGDAGAATLISAEAGAQIGEFILGTDGAGAKNLIVPVSGSRRRACAETQIATTDQFGSIRTPENLFMDGQELFEFTLRRVPSSIAELLNKTGLTADQIDWFIMHQANRFMLDQLRNRLKIPKERVPVCIESIGNTVSSSIPITMHQMSSQFRSSNRMMLVGFGVGYSWGACDLVWDESVKAV
jgi:3-oxoacyl-[acyl-carrier-protein] synthase-3